MSPMRIVLGHFEDDRKRRHLTSVAVNVAARLERHIRRFRFDRHILKPVDMQ